MNSKMACWNDFYSVAFKCSYEPCGYEESRMFNKRQSYPPYESEFATFICPKCNLFTFKRKPIDLGLQWSKGGLTGILYVGIPHEKLKHLTVWKPVHTKNGGLF